MKKINNYCKLLLITLVSLQLVAYRSSICQTPDTKTKERPSKWATSVKRKGLPNFWKVSDQFYRGAQPTKEGVRELKKMGIKTIVNLRYFHSDRKLLGDSGLSYEHIHVSVLNPKRDRYVRFLKIVADPSKQPVFVHCKLGSDRTGVAAALYRIFVQNWNKEDAITEMTEGDYDFHKIHSNLIKFVRDFKYSPNKPHIPNSPSSHRLLKSVAVRWEFDEGRQYIYEHSEGRNVGYNFPYIR